MDKNKEKTINIIIISAFAFLLLLASLFVPAMVANEEEAKPTQTPEPAATPFVSVTAELVFPTQTPAHFVPTNLIIDGEKAGTLASYQAAESCIEEIIEYYESMLPAGGAQTVIENEVVFEEDEDAKGIVTADALAALLVSDDSPVELTVLSTLTSVTKKVIHCSYDTEKDKYLVEGTRVVEVLGHDGYSETTVTSVYKNGRLYGDEESETVIIEEAVNGVVRIGTMERDETASPSRSEGKEGRESVLEFHSPISGSVIENFGQKNGVLHLGLDYRAESGSDVKAACGGIVVSVLERGGYGLCVEIEHGDGFTTRYALLDSVSVSLHSSVETGDVIGKAGNGETALHFELRIDGEAYNPRYYLD